MGSATWGTGTDIFAVDYLDSQVPDSGNNQWKSSDIYDHMLSALELKRMNAYYEAGADKTKVNALPDNTPLSLKTEGASAGYYRTVHYKSYPAEDYFFSQNVLMYDRHIITNVSDIQRLVWKPTILAITLSNISFIDGSTGNATVYMINPQFESNKVDILKKNDYEQTTATGINIVPTIISPSVTNSLQTFNYWDHDSETAIYYDTDAIFRYAQTYGSGSDNVARYSPVFNSMEDIILPNTATEKQVYTVDDTGNYLMRITYKAADQYSYLWTSYAKVKYWVCSEDELCHVLARSGLKFEYNNTIYKPVAANGVITGYTDNMDEKSEWDDWHDYTDHTVPITPPSPPSGSDEDNDDPISTIGAPFGQGLAHYYVMTTDSVLLQHISDAMSTHDIDTDKKDLYRNLISCKLIKPPAPIPTTGSEAFTIYGVKPQYEGSDITVPVVTGHPTATFGSYSIPRKFNDFRDYSPYSKAEIFLPYCGWCNLPSHVIGRSVSVHYYTDIIAATCKAIVFCGNNIVAEASGIIGLDIPFASENVGAKMQAANTSLLATASGAVETALGVGTVVATKGQKGIGTVVKGLFNYASGFSQMAMAANENWTEISGKTGDGCNLAGVNTIIIKITRPKYGSNTTAPYVPSNYGHASGFISLKTVTVGSVTGFLQADNVDTSGITGATERERQLIKAYLESGIFVNHPS